MATFSESVSTMWRRMERGLRFAFGAGVIVVLAAMIWGMVIVLRDDYHVLFSQLTDGDAAAIVDALKRQKVPYKLSEGGTTISVPEERVHEIRLGLMSSNVALNGNVGFEIFDKQGLGVTEQSQRVSYQRALQGELARTISALENVKQARVHLVLPESSLFKRDKQDATAAVTLTMRPGMEVTRQQILGVQRLVAASVPGLDPTRVTITDHRGVTLSAAADPGTGSFTGVEARLELQREVESHVAHKIADALDRTYGPGQAIISVAVALSFDAIKTTTQDLMPVRGSTGSEGGVKRRKQTNNGADSEGAENSNSNSGRHSASTEIEFDYGHRIEEVIAAPGAVKRMTIGVIVPPRIGAEEQTRLREFVMVAAGVDALRGDVVSVQSLAATANPTTQAQQVETSSSESAVTDHVASSTSPKRVEWYDNRWLMIAVIGLVLALAMLVLRQLLPQSKRRTMSVEERNKLLADIRRALGDESRVSSLSTKQS